MLELILGGARSGKSALAERLAAEAGGKVVYVATATAGDAEMAARIARHRERRPAEWRTVEAPIELPDTLQAEATPERVILVDCLTLWLSNCLAEPELWHRQRELFLECLPGLTGRVILVSNEVGQGIVPLGDLTRRFVDEAGWLHQAVAAHCDRVLFTVAGLPQVLKGSPL